MAAALRQRPVVVTTSLFPSRVSLTGERGSVAGFLQPIRGRGCVRPGTAALPGAGCISTCVCGRYGGWMSADVVSGEKHTECVCEGEI